MAAQKRNLLEAFRNAGEVPLPQDEAAEGTLKPLSPEEESILAEEARLKEAVKDADLGPLERLPPSMPFWLPWLAAMGMVFVIGIAIGRGIGGGDGDGDVQAAGEADSRTVPEAGLVPPPEDVPRPAPSSPPSVAAPSARASALYDPANAWTVVVITYSRTAAAAEDLAWATHDHLRDAGVPVFPPVEVGNQIVVLAGAAPRASDLADLERTIEGLSRNGRPRIYDGAYPERIDTLIDRD